VLLVGCVQVTPPGQHPRPVPRTSGVPSLTDPCADRLQTICDTMLTFVAVKKKLPDSLEELRPFADVDAPLEFTCPASGKPYVYMPDGLGVPGQERRLILYDAIPAHNGWSWGVVMMPPSNPQPLTVSVVRLSPEVLKAYLSAGPGQATPTPGAGAEPPVLVPIPLEPVPQEPAPPSR
jgi:hypothetical protein